MPEIVTLSTVRDREHVLRTQDEAHRRDALALLLKWRDAPGLRKTPEAQLRIDRLLHEFASR